MAFLGGYISPGLTAATQLASGYESGQAIAGKEREARAAKQIALLRQQHQDEIANALKGAQTAVATRTASAPVEGSPEWIAMKKAGAGAEVEGQTPGLVARDDALRPGKVKDATALIAPAVAKEDALTPGLAKRAGAVAAAEVPAKVETARQTSEYAAPIATQDVPGGPVTYKTRSQALGSGKAPSGGGGSQTSAQAALAMQRLGMSLADVRAAHDRMTAAENDPEFRKLLTTTNQAGMNAADVKPDIHASGMLGALNNAGGSLVSGLAQTHLDPRLNTYRRDKETVGTALTEVLPRPNQQLLQIEKGLSGIDAGWNPELTAAAQSRRAQGITQLEGALSALQAGRGGATSPPSRAPLSPADKVRAARDPQFAKWLKDNGY